MAAPTDKESGLTVAKIREILIYDPHNGMFYWRVRRGHMIAGSAAGGMGSDGYFVLGVNRRLYKASRIAWAYMTGEWPPHEVEHQDTVKSNNKWRNLRLATRAQNLANKCAQDHSSIYKGVHWDKARKRWRAGLGHSQQLGRFRDEVAAAQAYDAAALAKYGAFARLNFPPPTETP